MNSKFISLAQFAVKSGLCAGTVYLTYDKGVWGNVEQGNSALNQLRTTNLSDLIGEEYSAKIPDLELPLEVTSSLTSISGTMTDLRQNIWLYYNSSIKSGLNGLDNLPDTVSGLAGNAKKIVLNNLK